MTDPYVGKLCFFRVYSGTVEAGTNVYNSAKNEKRALRTYTSDACKRAYRTSNSCYSGDIAAVVGLKNTTTGDTLCDENTSDYP